MKVYTSWLGVQHSLVATRLLFCSAYRLAGVGRVSSAGSCQDDRGGVSFKRTRVQPGGGSRWRVGPSGQRSPEEHLVVLGGAGQHAAEQHAAAEGFDRTGQKHSRGHHRGQRSWRQERGERKKKTPEFT